MAGSAKATAGPSALQCKGTAVASPEAHGRSSASPAVVPMSRQRPKPMERKPWKSSTSTRQQPSPQPTASSSSSSQRVQSARQRPGAAGSQIPTPKGHPRHGPEAALGSPEHTSASRSRDELTELSRLPTDGPEVSVNQEIRSLFDRAMGAPSGGGEPSAGDLTAHSEAEAAAREQEVPQRRRPQIQVDMAAMEEASASRINQGNSPARDIPDDSQLLERELAATEAHALKLTMQKEARRQQAEAQRRASEFEKGLQAELEAKVMGLLEEKDARVAEAELLRRDLQGRVEELQAMVNQLDHKIVQHSESYDVVLFELRKEYQHLVSEFRIKLEESNKAKLMEFMAEVRQHRQAQLVRSPAKAGRSPKKDHRTP